MEKSNAAGTKQVQLGWQTPVRQSAPVSQAAPQALEQVALQEPDEQEYEPQSVQAPGVGPQQFPFEQPKSTYWEPQFPLQHWLYSVPQSVQAPEQHCILPSFELQQV